MTGLDQPCATCTLPLAKHWVVHLNGVDRGSLGWGELWHPTEPIVCATWANSLASARYAIQWGDAHGLRFNNLMTTRSA